jgi:hypothetical protein
LNGTAGRRGRRPLRAGGNFWRDRFGLERAQ